MLNVQSKQNSEAVAKKGIVVMLNVQSKQNSEVETRERYCSNVEWYRIKK
jgi:hypothetical protein